jgi:hypothetical protein
MSQPSYFAVIPAVIRYDKNLSASEKLFYAEITALTNMNGRCFASNGYFAELYGVDRSTITSWVRKLTQKGFIDVEYEYEGKQITKRSINLIDPSGIHTFNPKEGGDLNNHVVTKSKGGGDLIQGGWLENPRDNNTLTESNNTPTESNTTKSVAMRIKDSNSYEELIPIWTSYLKTKGRMMTLTEMDVLQHGWSERNLSELKEDILHTMENGWRSLVAPKRSKAKTSTPYLDSLDDKPF